MVGHGHRDRAALAAVLLCLVGASSGCERIAGLDGVTDARARPNIAGAPNGTAGVGGDRASVEAGGGGAVGAAGTSGTAGKGAAGAAGGLGEHGEDGGQAGDTTATPSCTLGVSSLDDCYLE